MGNSKKVTAILLSGALLIATAATTFAKKPEVSPAEKEATNTNKTANKKSCCRGKCHCCKKNGKHGGNKKVRRQHGRRGKNRTPKT
ncbi:MAG: hypothetical protein LBJ83_00790 [Oscillospiraceae bacterium]|jgi:hypothetical protein|nr:hypothetical protein [Oscillospiraceae bacterium]